jgi:hypothetical protein
VLAEGNLRGAIRFSSFDVLIYYAPADAAVITQANQDRRCGPGVVLGLAVRGILMQPV